MKSWREREIITINDKDVISSNENEQTHALKNNYMKSSWKTGVNQGVSSKVNVDDNHLPLRRSSWLQERLENWKRIPRYASTTVIEDCHIMESSTFEEAC